MEHQKEQLKRLIESADWTAEEKQWLLNYLENSDGIELLEQMMQENFELNLENIKEINPEISCKLLKNIHDNLGIVGDIKPAKTRALRMWTIRIAAASVIIGMLSLGIYLFNNRSKEVIVQNTQPARPLQNDIPPGSDGAILTLDDGTQIVLDSAQNGALSQKGNLKVIKKGGQIIYTKQGNVQEVLYNTMTTQRGKQYQLVLADGSKVWLNAASSIRFPMSFVGKERRVEITGEAYFEVAPLCPKGGQKIPFIVKINTPSGDGGEVEVLGTHFNVNAYDDEATVKTTLLEGSVKVTKGSASGLLKPGQQTQLAKNGEIKLIKNADVEEAVAWKNRMFVFNETDLKTIMRQVMRWYDIEVVFEGNTSERFFTADISRNTRLSEFLKVFEESKIHYKIEGRKLTVIL